MKRNVYFDMDGTIVKWSAAPIEEVAKEGFFKNLKPVYSVCELVERLLKDDEFNIYILTATFVDDHSEKEKKEWVKAQLPDFPETHVICVPYGEPKGNFIERAKDDILIDDYTNNLKEWHGTAIKIYNGFNGTNGTWRGYSLHSNMRTDFMYHQFLGIASIN